MANIALIIGAIYGLLAVLLGAFGAHALGDNLTAHMQGVWHTAEHYQFYHALALLLVALLARSGLASGLVTGAMVCFALGTLIFSGSLYWLALSNTRWLGAITPVGGVLLIVGWALLVGVAVTRM